MIRTTVRMDIPAVVTIAEAIRLNVRNPQPEVVKSGFLVYILDELGYIRRRNDFFTVSLGNEHVQGFLMCYQNTLLQDMVHAGSIAHQDRVTDFLLNEVEGDFIFGDQIAIDQQLVHRGIGLNLMYDMLGRMQAAGIPSMYVTALHAPVRNEVSIAFCQGLGAYFVQEVTNKDGLTWGVYCFKP